MRLFYFLAEVGYREIFLNPHQYFSFIDYGVISREKISICFINFLQSFISFFNLNPVDFSS